MCEFRCSNKVVCVVQREQRAPLNAPLDTVDCNYEFLQSGNGNLLQNLSLK